MRLHRAGPQAAEGVPAYDGQKLGEEAALFIDWYAPLLIGEKAAAQLRERYLAEFAALWRDARCAAKYWCCATITSTT